MPLVFDLAAAGRYECGEDRRHSSKLESDEASDEGSLAVFFFVGKATAHLALVTRVFRQRELVKYRHIHNCMMDSMSVY